MCKALENASAWRRAMRGSSAVPPWELVTASPFFDGALWGGGGGLGLPFPLPLTRGHCAFRWFLRLVALVQAGAIALAETARAIVPVVARLAPARGDG